MKENKISNKVLFAILSILLIFVLTSHAFATTYYVSTDGSDSNPGTSDSPWRTIQKAANSMVAGDTVTVYAGTYSETVTETTSGTSGSRIIYQVNPGDTVTVNKFVLRGSYITLDGFTVTNTQAFGWHRGGIEVSGDYVIVQNNVVKNCNTVGIVLWASGSSPAYCEIRNNLIQNVIMQGMELAGTYNIIDGNEINGVDQGSTADSNGMYLYGGYHTISSNYIHDLRTGGSAHVDCIQTAGENTDVGYRALHNSIIEKNHLVNYMSGMWTFMLESFSSTYKMSNVTIRNNLIKATNGVNSDMANGDNLKVYNNTFIGDPSGRGWGCSLLGITTLDVRNNIFVDYRGGIFWVQNNTNQTIDYAQAWNQGSSINWGEITPTHRLTSSPLFVNFVAGPKANGDYQLEATSQCVDFGTTIASVKNDYWGVTRPQRSGYDLGAYENKEDGSPPLPPKGLRVIPSN